MQRVPHVRGATRGPRRGRHCPSRRSAQPRLARRESAGCARLAPRMAAPSQPGRRYEDAREGRLSSRNGEGSLPAQLPPKCPPRRRNYRQHVPDKSERSEGLEKSPPANIEHRMPACCSRPPSDADRGVSARGVCENATCGALVAIPLPHKHTGDVTFSRPSCRKILEGAFHPYSPSPPPASTRGNIYARPLPAQLPATCS